MLMLPTAALSASASPSKVVAGLGCRRGCSLDALLELLIHSLAQHALTLDNLAGLASIAHKRGEPGLHELAMHLKLELRFFTSEELLPYQSANSASPLTQATTGSPAVAEPCALALAASVGSKADLLGIKHRSASATCALATFDREPA